MLFRLINQITALLKLGFWSTSYRKGAIIVTLISVAGVVGVFITIFSIKEGFQKVLLNSVDPQGIIILRSAADSELVSILTRSDYTTIQNVEGLEICNGKPNISPELFVIASLARKAIAIEANVPFRGVTEQGFDVRPYIRLVKGRRFIPGKHEIIVGVAAYHEYEGLELGSKIRIGAVEWRVVGIFEANGGVEESEIWTDVKLLQNIYKRGTTYSSIRARLFSPDSLVKLKTQLERDPRLNIKVLSLQEYYADQSRVIEILVTKLGGIVTVMMSIGALLSAMNTMYSAIRSRTREFATVRVVGFNALPIICAVIIESIFLTAGGGIVGAFIAYVIFDGFKTLTMNWQSFSQVIFAFDVNLWIILKGCIVAVIIGLIGGIPPALRAARIPVAYALRNL